MSEENPATNVDTTHEQAEPGAQEAQATAMSVEDYKSALKRANSEAARYRTERNELRKDADAWRAQQEAEKSELQKLQEALQTKETEEGIFAWKTPGFDWPRSTALQKNIWISLAQAAWRKSKIVPNVLQNFRRSKCRHRRRTPRKNSSMGRFLSRKTLPRMRSQRAGCCRRTQHNESIF